VLTFMCAAHSTHDRVLRPGRQEEPCSLSIPSPWLAAKQLGVPSDWMQSLNSTASLWQRKARPWTTLAFQCKVRRNSISGT
jgi:hypothetical protein